MRGHPQWTVQLQEGSLLPNSASAALGCVRPKPARTCCSLGPVHRLQNTGNMGKKKNKAAAEGASPRGEGVPAKPKVRCSSEQSLFKAATARQAARPSAVQRHAAAMHPRFEKRCSPTMRCQHPKPAQCACMRRKHMAPPLPPPLLAGTACEAQGSLPSPSCATADQRGEGAAPQGDGGTQEGAQGGEEGGRGGQEGRGGGERDRVVAAWLLRAVEAQSLRGRIGATASTAPL